MTRVALFGVIAGIDVSARPGGWRGFNVMNKHDVGSAHEFFRGMPTREESA